MQIPGHHHGNRKLHDFRRLEAKQSQVQPPFGAAADTDQPGGQQQHHSQGVKPGRPDPENVWRHLAQNQKGCQAYSQPGALPGPAFEDLVGQVKEIDMEDVRAQIAEQEASDGNEHEHEHEHTH